MAATSLRRLVSSGLVLAAVSGLALVGLYVNRTIVGEDRITSAPASAPASTMSADHEHYLKQLRTKRDVKFKDASVADVLADFSKSLGIDLRLHSKIAASDPARKPVSFHTEEPVSHRVAIRLLMIAIQHHDLVLQFEEDGIVVAHSSSYRHGMKTYDLSNMSDYTTAKRAELLAQIPRDVSPDSWTADEAWLRAGESVFEIDIYQSLEVHNKLAKHLNRLSGWAYDVVLDLDIQSLQNLPFLEASPKKTKVDPQAIVARLRKKYAYQSVVKRLAYESGRAQPRANAVISDQQKERLQARDAVLQPILSSPNFNRIRSESLRMLHEDEAEKFARRQGFGYSRMPKPGASYLPQYDPPQLPLASADIVRSADDQLIALPATRQAAQKLTLRLPSVERLSDYHHAGEEAFLSIASMGHVKSKDAVAGFAAHAFNRMPKLHQFEKRPWYRPQTEQWAVNRLELVSLLKHKEPAVYMSEHLPRMEDLVEAKTRRLHGFENSALKRLQEGEDVVAKSTLNRIEMLGALRASKQCMQCHNVKYGQLLGAFSYVLLRDPQLDPEKLPAGRPGEKPIF